ncbi:unnamed protein product [Brassicogethes aeneus]|uniref:Armadillo repeat-containing protein 1 n=1 Tax=Brassicogethes aeneus TaxID=1431903 RepID=A0A9P0AZN0_BRAAE|nr:unnamed protein product [Brassicogethes aeneus]
MNEVIEQLKLFKRISSNVENHEELLTNQKVILYAAVMLEKSNLKVVELCLDIIENFIGNENTHKTLISTFGIYEAVESLNIRMRGVNDDIFKRSNDITEILRNSTPPAYNTRSKAKCSKKNTLHLVFVENLSNSNKNQFEQSLLKVKGVISFLLDMQLQRCTLRLCPSVTIKEVVKKVQNEAKLKCFVVTKNKLDGNESLCDIMQLKLNKSYFEYLEDEIISPRKMALKEAGKNVINGGCNFLKSVATFWNDSFYW